MATIGLTEAGEALRDYFGPQLNADRGEGPRRMVDALVERFHISKDEAKKLVDDLIAADSAHFVSGGGDPRATSEAALPGTLAGTQGQPVGILGAVPGEGGYWRFK